VNDSLFSSLAADRSTGAVALNAVCFYFIISHRTNCFL